MILPSRFCPIGFRLLVVAWIVTISGRIHADELDVKQLQAKIYSAVDQVMPAVVAINDRGSIFSGVIVNKEGIVLSAGHAVRPNRKYSVMLADGRRFKATGLGANIRVDMSMLKILEPENLPVAEMGDSSVIVLNQPCVSISFPGTYDPNRGAVVRFGYVNKPITNNEGMIESTAKMEPGDSGGPLVDLDGKVIGIHSNIRESASKNYDVPINSFRQYWEELENPERFSISGWPSLPKLGFQGEDGKQGVKVIQVYSGGLAKASGVLPGDVIERVSGTKVTNGTKIYDRLVELRSKGLDFVVLSVLRDSKSLDIKINFFDPDQVKPVAYPELRDLASEFKSLESRLDDVQVVVKSKIDRRGVEVWATRIRRSGRGNVISKSTRVGNEPKIELADGSLVDAEIIARDTKNDLVLLHAEFADSAGIDLNDFLGDVQERRGKLLLTPDANGEGRVSIWGSRYFNVRRTGASGGYLGVMLAFDSGSDSVVFDRVFSGGARSAGIKSGDVLLKLGDVSIKREDEVRKLLRQQEPNSTIKILIKRDDAELAKEVVLGNPPVRSRHVADSIIGGRSDRRDGFSLVISHDANLRPWECGGPIFDIDGDFLGINISRTSRTRCYVIPRMILKQFVDQYGK